MSSEKNQYGLSKHRPSSVEEEIRQRCGFGCVICGLCFYDYEHFNPDFKDARIHDPRGMTLLCMQCNQKKMEDCFLERQWHAIILPQSA